MQITRLLIENFKGIERLELSFLEEGTNRPRPLTMLLGDNGSGKTTVLQAIALVLSLATRKTEEPAGFDWPGFMAERVSSLGSTRVELGVRFEPDELRAIENVSDGWEHTNHRPRGELYFERTEYLLTYENGRLDQRDYRRAKGVFEGRHLIRQLLRTQSQWRSYYERIGDVFWFDQNRNLTSLGRDGQRGVGQLREFLVGWWGFHTSQRRTEASDYLGRLEKRFAEIFPGTSFVGIEPRSVDSAPSAADFYFLLKRGERVYDLAEMSSGEQAIFPLLYEFVRQDITRSVVLIDELELHLHPPQQQALLNALRRIGPDCQFIVTSHSPYLETIVPDDAEIRLPGGQRCL
ncbi:AAA family ATPase [Hyalangium minutum]|uniref:ATPase n=1 Tax=Hyalangium minutum TaxID=394096 RepID=A0A085WKD4_9BACT|nr:AAA family ATPase [Hyalangium minutum]KFE68147.1 ATPase [Hyalangium minutum]